MVLGLVVGTILGIFAGTYLAVRCTRAQLDPDLAWADVFGVAALAGIGITAALLIGGLAFPGTAVGEHVKGAVLIGSLMAALPAAVFLRRTTGATPRVAPPPVGRAGAPADGRRCTRHARGEERRVTPCEWYIPQPGRRVDAGDNHWQKGRRSR